MKKSIIITAMALLAGIGCSAQEDVHLRQMVQDVMALRKAKANNDVLNKAVIDWSATDSPKVTLMDEIRRDDENEYRGRGANKFRMNQVVTHVYNRQNVGMVSKGDYFNSTEKDVLYSAIEKTVKKGCTANYTLTGHIGTQEFVFMSFNPKAKFKATVNGTEAIPTAEGVCCLRLGRVKASDVITFAITNNSSSNESFVILNYNQQK